MDKAKQIIAMLSDRSGFDSWYENCDKDIQTDILEAIAHIIDTPKN